MKERKEKIKKLDNKSKGFFSEFKTFIQRGNAFDLAVAVIIGNAFSKIVSSLVDDILMPLISMVLSLKDFSTLSFTINNTNVKYGLFIQNVVDFLIVSFCIFLFIKVMNRLFKKKEDEKPKEEIKKDEKVVLLEEIRDLLKK